MEPRRVMIILEVETGLSLKIIKAKMRRVFFDVKQVQVNVVRKRK